MRKIMDGALLRYGTSVQVVHGNMTTPLKAIFQPVSSKNCPTVVTPLGTVERGQYLYIGPADQALDVHDRVIVDGICYAVTRVESYRDDKQEVYRWAVCMKEGGKDAWASQV